MQVIVNKYMVSMYENGRSDLSKSFTVVARSGEEALNKVVDNKEWYEEAKGYHAVSIKYPVTFIVKPMNEDDKEKDKNDDEKMELKQKLNAAIELLVCVGVKVNGYSGDYLLGYETCLKKFQEIMRYK